MRPKKTVWFFPSWRIARNRLSAPPFTSSNSGQCVQEPTGTTCHFLSFPWKRESRVINKFKPHHTRSIWVIRRTSNFLSLNYKLLMNITKKLFLSIVYLLLALPLQAQIKPTAMLLPKRGQVNYFRLIIF